MKRFQMRLLLVSCLAVIVVATASAQIRFDANISIPYYFGINLADSFGSSNESLGTASKYVFLIPDFQLGYQFGGEVFRAGIGVRAYTVLIESIVFPNAFIELELNPVVFRADVGGGAFLFFGLYSDLITGKVILPDLSVAIKISDWFEFGTGAIAFVPLEAHGAFGWAGYVNARFMVIGK
jgi:hypothetical protein